MKELQYLNKYFIKYKYRFLLGIVITIVAQIFSLFTPELIGNSIKVIEEFSRQSDATIGEVKSTLIKNILLILQEEAYFNQVKDATNGAYYIEQLTDIIIEKSWEKFQEIEKMGGFLAAFEKGEIAKWIKSDLNHKQTQFKNEELILLGTNKHPNSSETRSEKYQVINSDDKFLAPYRLAQTKLN
jgi:ABC-type multidrug transport system fused ATPase/permease subunit